MEKEILIQLDIICLQTLLKKNKNAFLKINIMFLIEDLKKELKSEKKGQMT